MAIPLTIAEKLGFKRPNSEQRKELLAKIKGHSTPSLGICSLNNTAHYAKTIQEQLTEESFQEFHRRVFNYPYIQTQSKENEFTHATKTTYELFKGKDRLDERVMSGIYVALLNAGLTLKTLMKKLLRSRRLNYRTFKKLAKRAISIPRRIAELPLACLTKFERHLVGPHERLYGDGIHHDIRTNSWKEENLKLGRKISIKPEVEDSFVEEYKDKIKGNGEVSFGCPAKYVHLQLPEDKEGKKTNFIDAIYRLLANKVGQVLFNRDLLLNEPKSKRKIADELIKEFGFRKRTEEELLDFTRILKTAKQSLKQSNKIQINEETSRAGQLAVAAALIETLLARPVQDIYDNPLQKFTQGDLWENIDNTIYYNLRCDFRPEMDRIKVEYLGTEQRGDFREKLLSGIGSAINNSISIVKIFTDELDRRGWQDEASFDDYAEAGLNLIKELADLPQYGLFELLLEFLRFGNLSNYARERNETVEQKTDFKAEFFEFEYDDFRFKDDLVEQFKQLYKDQIQADPLLNHNFNKTKSIPSFGCPAKFAKVEIPDPEFPDSTMKVSMVEAIYRLVIKMVKEKREFTEPAAQ